MKLVGKCGRGRKGKFWSEKENEDKLDQNMCVYACVYKIFNQ